LLKSFSVLVSAVISKGQATKGEAGTNEKVRYAEARPRGTSKHAKGSSVGSLEGETENKASAKERRTTQKSADEKKWVSYATGNAQNATTKPQAEEQNQPNAIQERMTKDERQTRVRG
jgi:hypothetical protein